MNKANPGYGQPYNELLGPGAIYTNYGLTNEHKLGLTKGGNSFTDNAEFREREADSDIAPIKGAIDLVKMVPQLTIKALRIDAQAFLKYYAGMQADTVTGGVQKLYRTVDLSNSYNDNIAFVGQTRGGDNIAIVLDNAIGLNALSLAAQKKDEIVSEVVFTATADPKTFDPEDKTTYPYHVEFEVANVTFTVTGTGDAALEGATITLDDGQTGATDASGQTSFECTFGKIGYTIVMGGYANASGVATIDEEIEAIAVSMTAS